MTVMQWQVEHFILNMKVVINKWRTLVLRNLHWPLWNGA